MRTLYGEVADKIITLIEQGTFREGDKVPSIRTLSERYAVSVNTIKEAYGLLETQRFLEARPQSGYYVRRKVLPLPRPSVEGDPRSRLNPREISMCRIFSEVTRNGQNQAGASLAIARPDNSLLPSKKLNQEFQTAWKTLGRNTLDYAHTPGLRSLREQIAQQGVLGGMTLSPNEIVVTSGGSEAVSLVILSLCQPGDTLAVETPTYFNFLSFLLEMGIRVLEIPTSPEEGVNLEVLSWALDHHNVKGFLTIPNFNNPLGFRMSDERKKALVELMENRKIPLIEDDVYGDLPFSGRRPLTCKSFDTTGNVILVSGFSKTLAPGYRVGWIVPGARYDKLDRMKSLFSVASATPTQHAVARFLETGAYERHLRNLRQTLAEQMGAMAEVVCSSFPEGTRISRPAGGFVLWVELPGEANTLDLYDKALPEGIVFSPGGIFSASGKYENALRLNAGVWNPEVEAAVRRLGVLARENLA